jgi:hypothetical protein
MPDSPRRRSVVDVILPALLISLQLSLFGPYTIYSGNEAEFTASFSSLVRHLVVPAALVFASLSLCGLALRGRWRQGYVALLFALSIVLWIQANLLVANYGPLDGSSIDWSIQAWRTKYELALWIAVPLLAVLAAGRVAALAAFGSGTLIALQTALLIFSTLQADPDSRPEWRGIPDAVFEVSRTRNAFHLVLDAFNSDVFDEILEAERPVLDRQFSGFVFFQDHAGAFPTTIVSVPAMLSGSVYRNSEPLPRYVRGPFKDGSLFGTLRSSGYRVDSITEMPIDRESATNFFKVPRPYVSKDAYTQFAAWQLADLSLFRHAPHVLRPWIFNDQAWRLQNVFGRNPSADSTGRRYHAANGAVVLEDFARRLQLATDEPVYKFLHVGIPHLPVVVDADCRFTGVIKYTRESFLGQARCGVRRVAAFLDRLRELGIYDQSLIVITADHGNSLAPRRFVNDRALPDEPLSVTAGKSLPLLLIKPPKAAGPIRVSQAPSTITDIPVTIADALGVPNALPGEPILKIPENTGRVRAFAAYDWENEDWRANYFDHLDVLEIRGRVRDGNSWILRETLYAPGSDESARNRGLYELQRSSRGVLYRWGSPHVALHAPPNARGFEVTFRSIAPQPQTVTIKHNGQTLETITLKDHNWVTVRHALPKDNPAANWVEMFVDPPWRPKGTLRYLGVMTRDLKWMP